MLSSAEIARGTRGALRFLRFDQAAPLHFDNTMSACLRSFLVMIVAAPLYAAAMLLRYSEVAYTADDLEVFLIEALHYVVDWLLFPVIFYEIARLRGWLDRYPRYISALNWMNLPALAISVVVLAIAHVMPEEIADLLRLGLLALTVYWLIVATRITLGVSWPISALLMLTNVVPSELLSLIVSRILHVTPIGS